MLAASTGDTGVGQSPCAEIREILRNPHTEGQGANQTHLLYEADATQISRGRYLLYMSHSEWCYKVKTISTGPSSSL
jgi:hypothetical protein